MTPASRWFESSRPSKKKALTKVSAFFNDVCLTANDAAATMMFPSEMMSASPDVIGKHRIIASEKSNIILAKQMHHIAKGDASLKCVKVCDII